MKYLTLILFLSIIGILGCEAKAPDQDERPCLGAEDKPIRDISRMETCHVEEGGPEGVCAPYAMLPSKILFMLAECKIKIPTASLGKWSLTVQTSRQGSANRWRG